jgi:hypothetical protein
MDELDFHGYIAAGSGRHNELVIPGRLQMPAAPADWPERLHPGSLNVRLFRDRLPPALSAGGRRATVEIFDLELFQPEFEIPHDRIGNNSFGRERGPRGGDAQVWRASLFVDGERVDTPQCWVLRRFGSRVGEQLELVSGARLRDVTLLADGRVVVVRVLGRWADMSNTVIAPHRQ